MSQNKENSKLSAYLLNELSEHERKKLESEFERNPKLKEELEDIRETVNGIGECASHTNKFSLDPAQKKELIRKMKELDERKFFHNPWFRGALTGATLSFAMLIIAAFVSLNIFRESMNEVKSNVNVAFVNEAKDLISYYQNKNPGSR